MPCSRYDLQVRLSTSSPGVRGVTWCCKIKLRREYGPDNKQLDAQPKEEDFKTITQVAASATPPDSYIYTY